MQSIYTPTPERRNRARLCPVEQLSRHAHRSAPWPVRRLARRFGLGLATATTIAEALGYTGGAR